MLTAQCIDLMPKPIYMRKVLLSFTCLSGFLLANAQQKEGTIVFERKINMYKTITDEQMRAMMPEFRTSKHMLLFSDSISVYKAIPEDEAPDPFAGGGGGGAGGLANIRMVNTVDSTRRKRSARMSVSCPVCQARARGRRRARGKTPHAALQQ